jgi:hypothetical protein
MKLLKHLSSDKFSHIDCTGMGAGVAYASQNDWASALIVWIGTAVISVVVRAVVKVYG